MQLSGIVVVCFLASSLACSLPIVIPHSWTLRTHCAQTQTSTTPANTDYQTPVQTQPLIYRSHIYSGDIVKTRLATCLNKPSSIEKASLLTRLHSMGLLGEFEIASFGHTQGLRLVLGAGFAWLASIRSTDKLI